MWGWRFDVCERWTWLGEMMPQGELRAQDEAQFDCDMPDDHTPQGCPDVQVLLNFSAESNK